MAKVIRNSFHVLKNQLYAVVHCKATMIYINNLLWLYVHKFSYMYSNIIFVLGYVKPDHTAELVTVAI